MELGRDPSGFNNKVLYDGEAKCKEFRVGEEGLLIFDCVLEDGIYAWVTHTTDHIFRNFFNLLPDFYYPFYSGRVKEDIVIQNPIITNGSSGEKHEYTSSNTNSGKSENNIDVSEAKSQQTTVYITKNSRVYHKRNCSELNTNDLIEFASSQKADDAGGVPCNNCNPSTVVEESTKQHDKLGKSRTTYEWTGWKSLFKSKN